MKKLFPAVGLCLGMVLASPGHTAVKSVVLVHGAFADGSGWSPVAAILEHDGYTVFVVQEPETTFEADVATTRLVLDRAGPCVLVGHSYGGMVITGAADRALSRVGHLVFLDAAHPRDGESLVHTSPALMNEARRQARVIDGIELVLWPGDDACRNYGITDPSDEAWMQDKLTPHPWKCFDQPLRLANEAAVRKIPYTNINCTWSLKVRPLESARRAREGDRVWEIDTGHDLMITEPKAVAEILLRLPSL